MNQNIAEMHKKFAPEKSLGNFWKGEDYKTVVALLEEQGIDDAVQHQTTPYRGQPASILVHPLVALAFLRWADQKLFYAKLNKIFVVPSNG